MSAFIDPSDRMLKSWSAKLGHLLILYGGWGLFGMSFLDSSLVPFPAMNDLGLIIMASRRPALWPFYALASTVGSVLGTYVFYGIARGGGKFFFRKTTPQSVARARRWLERNDFVAILVASLLPPPAPMKAFVLTAGLLRVNAVRFGLALLVGRGVRFAAEAWLGAQYGARAQDYLRHNLGWVSLLLILLIVGLAVFRGWWSRRNRQSGIGTRNSGATT